MSIFLSDWSFAAPFFFSSSLQTTLAEGGDEDVEVADEEETIPNLSDSVGLMGSAGKGRFVRVHPFSVDRDLLFASLLLDVGSVEAEEMAVSVRTSCKKRINASPLVAVVDR